MKWLWITALSFLVTEVKSGPTRKDGNIVDGTITKIERTGTPDVFKFTLSGSSNSDVKMILLEVSAEGIPEEPVQAQDITQLPTPSFQADLTKYSEKEATFLITAKNDAGDDLAQAHAVLSPFPKFPEVTETTILPDPRDSSNNGILLRVQGSLGDMSLTCTETLHIQDATNYFAFANETSADYSPCTKSSDVEVCDKQLDHTVKTGTVASIVSSAVLAYGTDAKATIKLSLPLGTVDILEAILIPQLPQSPDENALCTKEQVTGTTCTIDWKYPSSNVLQLIIIQKTTEVTGLDTESWATATFDIHDRQLVVNQLGADIIEGRWLIMDGEYSNNQTTQSIYRLGKTEIGTNPLDTQEIDVDCTHLSLDPKLCFGYFPHLEQGTTHTLTVAYKGSGAANELDQIESSPVKITASEPELEILSRHTTTHQNLQKADVQICFQHLTPTEGRSFSHYEMLIINGKGQWLKHRIMQEEEEEEEEERDASGERLCFTPFTISTKHFDLAKGTKVVISQRGVDGVTVLASGESPLF